MGKILFRNTALLDVDAGKLRSGQEVLVSDDRIEAVGEGIGAPSDVQVVDLGGRTIMPGLIDCHVHINTDGMHAYPMNFPSLAAARASKVLRDTLMRGYTTVRDAGGADVGYRQAVEEGLFTGPRLFVCGRPLSQTGGHGDNRYIPDENPMSATQLRATNRLIADGVDEVRKATRGEIRTGVNQIKVMASGGVASPSDPIEVIQYSMDELRAINDEAVRYGIYVMAHAYNEISIERCVDAGIRSVEHGNYLTDRVAKKMAAAGTFLVPTQVVYRTVVEHGHKMGVSALHLTKAKQVADTGTESLLVAQRNGVKMAFGSDLFRAPKEYQSNEFLIRAEVLEPAEVLRHATINAAELLRMEGKLGRIAPGHIADLLVVDGDPLSDLKLLTEQGAHMKLIMKDGKAYKDEIGLD